MKRFICRLVLLVALAHMVLAPTWAACTAPIINPKDGNYGAMPGGTCSSANASLNNIT